MNLAGSLLHPLRAAREFEPRRYLSMALDGRTIGWILRDEAGRLRRWPAVFEVWEGNVSLKPTGESALSAAFAQVAQTLADEGVIRGWRDETYAIRAGGSATVLFHLERAAMRFFGLTSSAAHLNGFFLQNEKPTIWIARRSATKSIDPGMLDNLVAGGVPSGEGPWQTLLRECGEEAGIPAELARAARAAGVLHLCRDIAEGLHSEILHVHDLALPADFAPRNTDGEVSEFHSLDARGLLERIERGEMTVAAALVTLDFVLRQGVMRDDDGKLEAALDACRVPTPA